MNPVTKTKANISATQKVLNSTECFHVCVANTVTKNCLTWTFDNATKLCYLYESPLMNLNNFNDTAQSGLIGTWSKVPGIDCLNYHVASPSVGPSGDIATCVLANSNDTRPSFTASNDLSDLLNTFSEKDLLSNIGSQGTGLHGASSQTFSLDAEQSKTVTFLLAWYYPNRDFFGGTLGNQYMHFFGSIGDVAGYVRNSQHRIVHDISMLHGAFMNSSMGTFLQDIFVNSLSHIRSALWFGDSRYS